MKKAKRKKLLDVLGIRFELFLGVNGYALVQVTDGMAALGIRIGRGELVVNLVGIHFRISRVPAAKAAAVAASVEQAKQ